MQHTSDQHDEDLAVRHNSVRHDCGVLLHSRRLTPAEASSSTGWLLRVPKITVTAAQRLPEQQYRLLSCHQCMLHNGFKSATTSMDRTRVISLAFLLPCDRTAQCLSIGARFNYGGGRNAGHIRCTSTPAATVVDPRRIPNALQRECQIPAPCTSDGRTSDRAWSSRNHSTLVSMTSIRPPPPKSLNCRMS